MLFNSFVFAVFLPIVFFVYWLLRKRLRLQNALLLVASYIFYGWWDYRFLSLIVISSLADYIIGGRLEFQENSRRRKFLLAGSVAVNIGILGFFKYFGFFVGSFAELLTAFGLHADVKTLNIVLPVGISFYTFQTMSYTLDIYRRQIHASRDMVAFLAFVSFFPQLVAGPIERAKSLLPQFERPRTFDLVRAKDGVRQMAWGLLKKVVIADNLAKHVEAVFSGYATLDFLTLTLGVIMFAFQIYCDFSGYSDIAIGVARLFGFRLMRNFAFPYFARDIAEFWRRWHISLSTWFRDYVYIPLGGSRTGKPRRIWNIIVTFTVSGLWHGANWTFIIWGLLHGLYYLPLMLINKQKAHTDTPAEGRLFPRIGEALAIITTFVLVLFSWIFFRADSLQHAFAYIRRLAQAPWIDYSHWHSQYAVGLIYIALLVVAEWLQRDKQHALEIAHLPTPVRWASYIVVSLTVLFLGNFGEVDFIYFQF